MFPFRKGLYVANHRSVEKERYWRGIVEAQDSSGLSIRAYCRQQKVSEPSFYVWRRKLRQPDRNSRNATSAAGRGRRSPKATTRTGFIPVQVTAGRQPGIEIETPNGVVIRLREDVPSETLQRVVVVATYGASGNGPSSC